MKLRCDGRSPCGSCQKRNLICNNERTAGSSRLGIEEGTTSLDNLGYNGRLMQTIQKYQRNPKSAKSHHLTEDRSSSYLMVAPTASQKTFGFPHTVTAHAVSIIIIQMAWRSCKAQGFRTTSNPLGRNTVLDSLIATLPCRSSSKIHSWTFSMALLVMDRSPRRIPIILVN